MKPSDLDTHYGRVSVPGDISGRRDWLQPNHQCVVIGKVYEEMAVSTVHVYRAARLTIKVNPTRVKVGKAVAGDRKTHPSQLGQRSLPRLRRSSCRLVIL